MKIPSCILDAIAAMNSEECDFFNIEFHSDNLILINIKRMGEIFPRHYTFAFNDSFRIDNVTLEVMLPERNNKAWNDNGYPDFRVNVNLNQFSHGYMVSQKIIKHCKIS